MKNRTITSIIFALAISIGLYFYYPWKPKCTPYRNVTGYYALCTELNSVRNCIQPFCKGGRTTIKKTKFLLENTNGSVYLFANNQIITVADQNQIITQANIWASTNAPSGYSVYYIKFIPDIVTQKQSIIYAGIDIEVTYQKCNDNLPK